MAFSPGIGFEGGQGAALYDRGSRAIFTGPIAWADRGVVVNAPTTRVPAVVATVDRKARRSPSPKVDDVACTDETEGHVRVGARSTNATTGHENERLNKVKDFIDKASPLLYYFEFIRFVKLVEIVDCLVIILLLLEN